MKNVDKTIEEYLANTDALNREYFSEYEYTSKMPNKYIAMCLCGGANYDLALSVIEGDDAGMEAFLENVSHNGPASKPLIKEALMRHRIALDLKYSHFIVDFTSKETTNVIDIANKLANIVDETLHEQRYPIFQCLSAFLDLCNYIVNGIDNGVTDFDIKTYRRKRTNLYNKVKGLKIQNNIAFSAMFNKMFIS